MDGPLDDTVASMQRRRKFMGDLLAQFRNGDTSLPCSFCNTEIADNDTAFMDQYQGIIIIVGRFFSSVATDLCRTEE